jgi:hypothetical protein
MILSTLTSFQHEADGDMATKAKKNLRLTEELLEAAQNMRASGMLSKAAHEKIIKHFTALESSRSDPS